MRRLAASPLNPLFFQRSYWKNNTLYVLLRSGSYLLTLAHFVTVLTILLKITEIIHFFIIHIVQKL